MKRRSFLIGAAALMIQPYRVRETDAYGWRAIPPTEFENYHFTFHWIEYDPVTEVRFIDEPIGWVSS